MRYDATTAPDPAEWLELDEGQRVALVRNYHKHTGSGAPSTEGHAIMHAVVENQLAAGYSSACDAVERLTRAGLDRHEAIHAIGAVLAEHLTAVLQSSHAPSTRAYDSALSRLTVEGWRRSSES